MHDRSNPDSCPCCGYSGPALEARLSVLEQVVKAARTVDGDGQGKFDTRTKTLLTLRYALVVLDKQEVKS